MATRTMAATEPRTESMVRGGNGNGKTKHHEETLTIGRPNFQTVSFKITGTAQYVQNAFSAKCKEQMHQKHEAGETAKKGAKREKKDFKAQYEAAMHRSDAGWWGIPCPNFRNGMVSACKICGFQMTRAKLAVFVLADGYDREDTTPLVKITKGKPEYFESLTRNANGQPDLRARPLWRPGWEAIVRVRFDADMFTAQDVAHLMMRLGEQVGIGEGRPGSTNSCGLGWGTFQLEGDKF